MPGATAISGRGRWCGSGETIVTWLLVGWDRRRPEAGGRLWPIGKQSRLLNTTNTTVLGSGCRAGKLEGTCHVVLGSIVYNSDNLMKSNVSGQKP